MCMYGHGDSRSAIDEHGLLRSGDVELNCSDAVNVWHPQCLFPIRAKWLDDHLVTLFIRKPASC